MALFDGLASIQIQSLGGDGQAVSNTLHVSDDSASSAPDVTELTALLSDFDTWFTTTYRAILDSGSTLVQYVARNVSDPVAPTVYQEVARPVNLAGTRSIGGGHVPNAMVGLISFKTPNASRRFRGHIFLPAMVDNGSVDGRNVNTGSSYWSAMGNIVTKLQAGAGPAPSWTGTHLANYTLSIYSRRAAELGEPSVASVMTVTRQPRARWLRSRERGTT